MLLLFLFEKIIKKGFELILFIYVSTMYVLNVSKCGGDVSYSSLYNMVPYNVAKVVTVFNVCIMKLQLYVNHQQVEKIL